MIDPQQPNFRMHILHAVPKNISNSTDKENLVNSQDLASLIGYRLICFMRLMFDSKGAIERKFEVRNLVV